MAVIHGDCLEVMPALDAESVDAVVTDPPYGLEFMGKAWDKFAGGGGVGWKPGQLSDTRNLPDGNVFKEKGFGQLPIYRGMTDKQRTTLYEFNLAWATAALRVAKPSAYLLAFGGTRTVHRMACAIEDAGWVIRDLLVWAYASGFPKSRASLKPAWEPIVMARKPGPLRPLAIDACRIGTTVETWPVSRNYSAKAMSRPGSTSETDAETQRTGPMPLGRWPANVILTDPLFDGDTEGVVGGGMASPGTAAGSKGSSGFATGYDGEYTVPYGDSGTYSRFFMLPESGTMCSWCGVRYVGPSSSPDVPRAGSAPSRARTGASSESTTTTGSRPTNGTETPFWPDESSSTSRTGRWRGSQPTGTSRSNPASPAGPNGTSSDTTTTTRGPWMCASCADAATRFSTVEEASFGPNYPRVLIIPKADRADREPVVARGESAYRQRANHHPTVKPTELMRHLVRLVTPSGGVVLDPFLGSGTTAIAAEMEGFEWVGIEREAEYVAIAEARLPGVQRGMGL